MTAPENPPSNVEQAIGEVLAAHAGHTWDNDTRRFRCKGCGADLGRSYPDDAHRAHVAEQIAPLVDAARVEAWDEGHSRHGTQCVMDEGFGIRESCTNPYRERAERETP